MTNNSGPSSIGLAIRALRKTANMTLDDVATVAGVSVSYLSRAENGQVIPSAGWVQHVAAAIGERLRGEAA